MRDQSVNCGTRILTKTVESVDLLQRPFKITTDTDTYYSKAIIIATGATAQRLYVKGEDVLWQKGISACAVCDGALPLFRNKPLVVVGGGDSAAEEASFLTKYASKVILVVRRDQLRASKAMQERVLNNDKIEIRWNSVLVEALGDSLLSQVKLQNTLTKEESLVEASGLFYAIGHVPNTSFLAGQITLDNTSYIVTEPGSTLTNIEGVFACGDVQDKKYRQAVTAAGSGCMAALDAEKFLSEH